MALSRAGLNRRTALATSTLVIANNLPDIDVGVFATNTLAMSFRRGWTHGVLAQLTLPIALTGAMLLYDRYRTTRTPGERAVPSQILLLSYIGVLLHVFMDWTNSYGVRLLMPFSEQWFYGDALYIVDPWLYLTLGLGWWLAKRHTRPARIAVTVAAIYVLAMLGSNVLARQEVASGLARAGRPAATRFMAPVVVNPFRREVVIDLSDRYEKGLWFDPVAALPSRRFGLQKGFDDPLARRRCNCHARTRSCAGRVSIRASDAVRIRPRSGSRDYRYANVATYGWAAQNSNLEPEPSARET